MLDQPPPSYDTVFYQSSSVVCRVSGAHRPSMPDQKRPMSASTSSDSNCPPSLLPQTSISAVVGAETGRGDRSSIPAGTSAPSTSDARSTMCRPTVDSPSSRLVRAVKRFIRGGASGRWSFYQQQQPSPSRRPAFDRRRPSADTTGTTTESFDFSASTAAANPGCGRGDELFCCCACCCLCEDCVVTARTGTGCIRRYDVVDPDDFDDGSVSMLIASADVERTRRTSTEPCCRSRVSRQRHSGGKRSKPTPSPCCCCCREGRGGKCLECSGGRESAEEMSDETSIDSSCDPRRPVVTCCCSCFTRRSDPRSAAQVLLKYILSACVDLYIVILFSNEM